MTLVAVITQAAGRYCLESLNPAFAHVWVGYPREIYNVNTKDTRSWS